MKRTGIFISFEGGEGCGKSTHLEEVAKRLTARGRAVLTVREPGGTEVGEQIRHLLQHSRHSSAMRPETELLLFCASRAQLVREILHPALEEGKIVLADRFLDSTTVYQGVARGLDAEQVARINRFAAGDCVPDLTVVIDLDPRIGLQRVRGRELFDRMENETIEFHQRVREGYRELARREPQRVKLVDGARSFAEVQAQIWQYVEQALRKQDVR